jgi:hypothetical protein
LPSDLISFDDSGDLAILALKFAGFLLSVTTSLHSSSLSFPVMDGRWQFPSCIDCEQHHRPEPPGNCAHHQIPFTLVLSPLFPSVHVTTVLYCRRMSIVQ